MSTNANPNAIIEALLKIASAAYAVKHSERHTGFALTEVSAEDLEALENALAPLELLPQAEVDGHLTGPARARHHMQSFIAGGLTLGEDLLGTSQYSSAREALMLAHSRSRQYDKPKVVIKVDTSSADMEKLRRMLKSEPLTKAELMPITADEASGLNAARYEKLRAMHWSEGGPYCVVAMKDVGLGVQTYTGDMLDELLDALPPVQVGHDKDCEVCAGSGTAFGKACDCKTERRMRPRFIEPTLPGEDLGAMREQANAWHAVCATLDAYAPGWRTLKPQGMQSAMLAIEQLAKQRGKTMLTDMLADTADKAHKIRCDAELLEQLHQMCSNPDDKIEIDFRPHRKDKQWALVLDDDLNMDGERRVYEADSFHQMIVEAHKGETEREQPEEAEPAKTNGMREFFVHYNGNSWFVREGAYFRSQPDGDWKKAWTPIMATSIEDARARAEVRGAATTEGKATGMMPPHVTENEVRRDNMMRLLNDVKEQFGVTAAKVIIKAYSSSHMMADIPDQHVGTVIHMCLTKLGEAGK